MAQRSDIAVVPLGALSAVVLGLEVFQSRLVAYSVQNVMIYAVIGIALLGFGAAGSWVSLRQEWLQADRLPRALAWSALAFSVSIVVAHALFTRLSPRLLSVDVLSLGIAGVLGLPFLAAGIVVTLALSSTARVGTLYAANLIGSGVGCFLPLMLLGPLDGEHMLGLFALLAFGCALLFVLRVPSPGRALYGACAAALLLAVLSCGYAKRVFPIQPDPAPMGQLAALHEYAAKRGMSVTTRFDRWNPTGRIEIVQLSNVPGGPEPYPSMFYAQDSSAGSSLISWDGRSKSQVRPSAQSPGTFVSRMCTETLYAQGYFTPRKHVLVIGLGGGPDLSCALYQEAQAVDAVEINPDSIAAIRGPLNAWVGGMGSDPRVTFHQRDGRSFVHGQRDRFDLIQLSGVDTKNNFVSGALALSENHLYTLEAFRDYLRALTSDGAIAIIRFGDAETVRLAHTAIVALRQLGVQHPERHISVARTGVGFGLVIRRKPWTRADALAFDRLLHPPYFRGIDICYYQDYGLPFNRPVAIEYLPMIPRQSAFSQFFDSVARGELAASIAAFPWDVSVTTDDKPFFFDLFRYTGADAFRMPHVVAMRNLLVSMIALSLALILLPVRKLRARSSAAGSLMRPSYFACTGFGFILLEVWLLHRFTTYLGHQVYALSVVLATLLVATGVGAAVGEKFAPDPGQRARVGALMAVIAVMSAALLLPSILELTWHMGLPGRAAIAVVFIAPIGIALGQPFVAGLMWLRAREPASIPWCIGINGFCSVIGSVVVVPLLMAVGYVGSLVGGVAFYLLAALFARSMRGVP